MSLGPPRSSPSPAPSPSSVPIVLSCDVDEHLRIFAGELLSRKVSPLQQSFCVAQLYCNGVLEDEVESGLSCLERGQQKDGGEWLEFCVRVMDLPYRSSVVLYVFHASEDRTRCLGRCILPIFNEKYVGRQGRRVMNLLPVPPDAFQESEGSGVCLAGEMMAFPDLTNSPLLLHSSNSTAEFPPEVKEALRLDRYVDGYRRGLIPTSSFIPESTVNGYFREAQQALKASNRSWIVIQTPVYEKHALLFFAPSGPLLSVPPLQLSSSPPSQQMVSAPWMCVEDWGSALAAKIEDRDVQGRPIAPLTSLEGGSSRGRPVFTYSDSLLNKEHPAALKASILEQARGHRRSYHPEAPCLEGAMPTFGSLGKLGGGQPRVPKPSAEEWGRLHGLINSPRRYISPSEKELLLKYRLALTDHQAALAKILRALDWTDAAQAKLGVSLLPTWSPLDPVEALGLLDKEFSVAVSGKAKGEEGKQAVREYAVERLKMGATDVELLEYLLQLVQALRYDAPQGRAGPLSRLLASRASSNLQLASAFFWHLRAEGASTDVDAQTPPSSCVFSGALKVLWSVLNQSSTGQGIKKSLEKQMYLRERLLGAATAAKGRGWGGDKIEMRSERMRKSLRGESTESSPPPSPPSPRPIDLTAPLADPLPIPVDPEWELVSIDAESSFCIKSAMFPAVIVCNLRRASTHSQTVVKRFLFKAGDDLRQDQLVLQLVCLMDALLLKYGLNMKITPYRVLALSPTDGLVEWVSDSRSLAAVIAKESSIEAFLRGNPAYLDTFARSCAGYCVITYILGVGDRHLDNLLLSNRGHLFHVDFGYIFGRDPKPFPPPMKLCREMVEAMGGMEGPLFTSVFRPKCCQAYTILRRHAKLLMNLIYLMQDAEIESLSLQGLPAEEILDRVRQKLYPMLRADGESREDNSSRDEQLAEQYLLSLLDESIHALFPKVMEKLHQWALYWR